jgi:hypothetical protein
MTARLKSIVWRTRGARKLGRARAGSFATGYFTLSAGTSQFSISAIEKAFRKCYNMTVVGTSGYPIEVVLSATHKAGQLYCKKVSGLISQATMPTSGGSLSQLVGTCPIATDMVCYFTAFGI